MRKDGKQILHNRQVSLRVSASAPHLDACVECILGNVPSSPHVRHLKRQQRQITCGPSQADLWAVNVVPPPAPPAVFLLRLF